jgi:hypothetical protein
MPAKFLKLVTTDLFKSGGTAPPNLKIPEVDNIVEPEVIAMYDSVGAQFGETCQFFLAFDDVIKFIHFGKALGNIQVEGTMYANCDYELPAFNKYKDAFSALRGKPIEVQIYDVTVKAVMTGSSVTVIGDPDTLAKFSFQFAVVDHQM